MIVRGMLLVAALLTPVTVLGMDQPAQYYGITLGGYTLDNRIDGLNEELRDNADIDSTGRLESTDVGLRLGYNFSRYLGIEGRAGYSINQNRNLDALHDDLYYAGVFGRFNLPFERINVFALAGYSAVELKLDRSDARDFDIDREYRETDYAWGLGVELFGNERVGLTLDYMNYAASTHKGFSVGFVHHFDWPAFRQ